MRPLPPSSDAKRFLRYQFDNAAQLRRHCRQADGRVFLFFPDAQPTPLPRSRALIEICFTSSSQQVSLPAVVHSHELEGTPGAWLDLRALGVVSGMQSAISVPKRGPRRLALDQLAWVTHGGGPVLACPVLDVSVGGARLWGVPGAVPAAGEELRMRMPNAPTLVARIAWAHGSEVGVAFSKASLHAAAEVYARVEELWAGARFARHQPTCECAEGSEALNPPAPVPVLTGGLQ